jgi:hypothetical protein
MSNHDGWKLPHSWNVYTGENVTGKERSIKVNLGTNGRVEPRWINARF